MRAWHVVVILLLLCAGVQAAAGERYNFIDAWGSQGRGDGQFEGPMGITMDTDRYVYVADSGNNRFQKFNRWGYYVDTWGSYGTGLDLGFYQPAGIVAEDTYKCLFIADSRNSRVQQWNWYGTFISTWGRSGIDPGEFSWTSGVAVHPTSPLVYVSDDSCEIQGFDYTGGVVNPIPFARWGGVGSGDGLFASCIGAKGIAVDREGNVYAADTGNNRVQKFSPTGAFITKWGETGRGPGQFTEPWGIAIDRDGYVYVTDTCNYRVQKFTKDGVFVTEWGNWGSDDGEFLSPTGIFVDDERSVYVTDYGNNRVEKFAPALEPDFSVNTSTYPNYAWVGRPIQFTGKTYNGEPERWEWDFGDGHTSYQQNPVHVYEEAGVYDVNLTVWSRLQGSDSMEKAEYLAISNSWFDGHLLPCTVEAEEFDITGAETAYHDTTASNEGGAYRPSEGVDIEPIAGGGYTVCYVREGEWTTYTVLSEEAAIYPVTLRAGCWAASPARTIEIQVDSVTQETVTVPNTGSDTTFGIVAMQLSIPAGMHPVTLRFHGGSMNVDSMVFGAGIGPTALPGIPSAPTDLNVDGKYEDVNGNGRADFADVVLYFNQMSWVAANEPASFFDYNGNGRIDFADVVWLFNHL